jgi:hypothetical protein
MRVLVLVRAGEPGQGKATVGFGVLGSMNGGVLVQSPSPLPSRRAGAPRGPVDVALAEEDPVVKRPVAGGGNISPLRFSTSEEPRIASGASHSNGSNGRRGRAFSATDHAPNVPSPLMPARPFIGAKRGLPFPAAHAARSESVEDLTMALQRGAPELPYERPRPPSADSARERIQRASSGRSHLRGTRESAGLSSRSVTSMETAAPKRGSADSPELFVTMESVPRG